jgi:hypothetical protein
LLLFEEQIKDEGYSETTIELPVKYEGFVEKIKAKPRKYLQYRAIAAGYVHLKHLAHAYNISRGNVVSFIGVCFLSNLDYADKLKCT